MFSRAIKQAVQIPRLSVRSYASEAGAADKLRFQFALPHQTIFQDKEVLQVSVPAQTGEMGILSNHVPSVEALKAGVVEVIESAGQSNKYFISSGFASVHPNNTLTINAVEAYDLKSFDQSALKQNIADAQKASSSGSEVQKAEAAIELEVYSELEAALNLQFTELSDTISLLQTSKQFNSQFNIRNNSNLYANIFTNYFDLDAAIRRFHLTASGISSELKQRMIILSRFKWRCLNNVYDDEYLVTDLLRLYLIVIESDFMNRQYNSLISEYTTQFIHSDSFPHINNQTNSLILWLDYLVNDKPSSITPYKPFLFAAQNYDSFYAPWPYSTLPSSEFNTQVDDPFFTDLSLKNQSITLDYFGSTLQLAPPLSPHAAFLTLYKYKNNLPNPTLSSTDFDTEFIRLSHCTHPSKSPGCHSTLFKNHFQGAWEGFFCYYEFDDYRDILAGSIDTLYNGVYAIQPQVWRLNETLEDYAKPSSLSTLQDICGGHDDQHLSLKSEDTTHNDNKHINELLVQSDTIDDRKEIHLNGLGHSAWGRFTLRGKVRAWDGMFMLCKEYTPDRRGKWFYRGYALPGGVLIGRWRDTYTPEVLSGYEGCFVLTRR